MTLNLGIAEFGGGGESRRLSFDLNDPDHDGKMYFQEIVGAFDQGDTLRKLINISGEVSGELSVYYKLPFSPRVDHEIAKVTLYEFSPKITEPDPVLGEVDSTGVLRVNAGARAGERKFHGEVTDGNEQFEIVAGATANSVKVIFQGVDRQYEQTFGPTAQNPADVTRVIIDGGGATTSSRQAASRCPSKFAAATAATRSRAAAT